MTIRSEPFAGPPDFVGPDKNTCTSTNLEKKRASKTFRRIEGIEDCNPKRKLWSGEKRKIPKSRKPDWSFFQNREGKKESSGL